MNQKLFRLFNLFSPVIIGGALIWLLTQFTNIGEVGELLLRFPAKVNFLIFLTLLLYFSFKFFTLSYLIRSAHLSLNTPLIAAAFGIGELARELPVAIFFPALAIWKKEKLGGVKILAVPFLQVILELATASLFLTIFGLGNLKIFHLIGFAGILVITITLFLTENILKWLSFLAFVRKISLEFLTTLKNLIKVKVLLKAFILVLVYQFFLGLVFYQIILAIGIENINLTQAVSVFAANFVAAVISPLPFDLGVTESTGFLILTNMGVTPESALSAMFAQRAIVALSSWLLFSVIVSLAFGKIKKFLFEKS